MKSRLPPIVVVANRLPVHRSRGRGGRRWDPSPGGLVSAMTPVLKKHGGSWVGWSGVSGDGVRPFVHEGIRIRPLSISHAELERYYFGFSNRTIWPLYHDAIRTPRFQREWWKGYVDVNRRFAEAAAGVMRRGDIVWVHDYQLQLVPRMLRALRPGARIGFFLHVPFPPDELFAWLPWRREILDGLLGADVVGFQTHADAQDFSRAARQLTSAEGTDSQLRYKNRTTRVGSFPISIDFRAIETMAGNAVTLRRAAELRRRIGPRRKILLSVDRLDYTKGLDTRLLAYEEMLRRRKATAHDCVMIQIAEPSRESVAEYRELRGRVEQIVGRINGEFSMPGSVAVHYFRRSVPRDEIVAYYAASDIMLVTPIRDGMNLVAKEYVAARRDMTGVLVLSEFAGAAKEMRRAVLVNPRDQDGMVRALETALKMEPSEAKFRMSILRASVRRHDVHYWTNEFLNALTE